MANPRFVSPLVEAWIEDNDALSLNKNQSEGREGSLKDLFRPTVA